MERNLKRTVVLFGLSAAASVLLVWAILSTFSMPLLTPAGLGSWLVLLLLTLGLGRLTVTVTSTDGVHQSRKSIADAFVFLAVMLYAIPAADTAGPATLLAAIVAFLSTYHLASKQEIIFTTSMAVISTAISASSYGILVDLFAANGTPTLEQGLPLNIFLVPLSTLAVLQYTFSTLGTVWFLSMDARNKHVIPSQESIVWTLTTQLAGAAAAVLFYSAIRGAGVSYVLLGMNIMVLVHLLYRFNEKRLNEVRRAEADQRRHIEELATIHMNTIESLAIAIDAKDQTTHGHVRRTQIYATEMGSLFDVTEAERQALFAGALLHDIGKLAVPEYILNKPG
ncbi:MAG TPA: HD domain-containing protein, partial [Pyrinomonadaceae bacterium]